MTVSRQGKLAPCSIWERLLPAQPRAKTVQDHIDELPMWVDGTLLSAPPMTRMQWRIWSLAAAGKFFTGFILFISGVALPLFFNEFEIRPAARGVISAATLFGILVGASFFGGLADRLGRKPIFVVEMIILVAFLVALTLSSSFWLVVICLFGVGLSLGSAYPTASMVIAENIPTAHRGRLVLAAYAFQAVGALAGTAVGYLVLAALPTIQAWRCMYAAAIVPAVLVAIGRLNVVESANCSQGEIDKAERAARQLLVRQPQSDENQDYPARYSGCGRTCETILCRTFHQSQQARHHIGVSAVAPAGSWVLRDRHFHPDDPRCRCGGSVDHARSLTDLILNDITAAKGAALTTTLLIVGILVAVLLTDTVGRIALQVLGFFGCAAGLFLVALSLNFTDGRELSWIFAGFMLFNFMTSMGPSAQTHLLAAEVFPTKIRGKGAGFAAAVGKIGAVATAFLFPVLLDTIGTQPLLFGLVGTSILGAVVTWLFRIETTGVSLDKLEH
jgi:MFS transporter, putative metabolite transport protein